MNEFIPAEEYQWQIVLEHLKSGNSLTSLEAIERWGFTRLSAIICTLRKRGFDIETKQKKVRTRFGKETIVAEYKLVTEVMA